VGQVGAGNRSGQIKPKARQSGQILIESHRVADTEHGAFPLRSTATTLTDLDEHLVQMPLVTGLWPPTAQVVGESLAELRAPRPDRLLGDDHTAFHHHLLDLAKLSGKRCYSHIQWLMISTG
jgi:hypothetical protein